LFGKNGGDGIDREPVIRINEDISMTYQPLSDSTPDNPQDGDDSSSAVVPAVVTLLVVLVLIAVLTIAIVIFKRRPLQERRRRTIRPDDKTQNGAVTPDVEGGGDVITLEVKKKEEESKYPSVVVQVDIQPQPSSEHYQKLEIINKTEPSDYGEKNVVAKSLDNGQGGSEAKSDSGTPNGEGEEENEKEDERREKDVTFTESRRTMDISPDDKGQNGEV
jgi:hypothetical protein